MRERIAQLFPGYFALVMATGIISIAAHLLAVDALAYALFGFNIVAYLTLLALTAARLVLAPQRLLADVADHARGPGFFTTIAATCLLGSQFALLTRWIQVALVLWAFGILLWLVITYGFLLAVTVRQEKPTLVAGLSGGWLVLSVATQSVAVLSTLVAATFGSGRDAVLFFALALFLVGTLLYLILIGLIFYRWMFLPLPPDQMTPLYWINMGAAAIATLAGSRLILSVPQSELLGGIQPFLAGYTVLFWAAATWWIPLLVLAGIWRHVVRRVPLQYSPQFWSMDFPLGMYTACTFTLASALRLEFLRFIPPVGLAVAVVAWLLTLIGLARSLLRPAPPAAGTPPERAR
jgi:tellurite resistance protein TehA-like permease